MIAVSAGMRGDVLACYPALDPDRVHVVHNGIDTELYRPDPETDVLERLGVDPDRPYVVFVGRITRQKGVPHLLRAAPSLRPGCQLVLLAGAADTPELAAETEAAVAALRAERDGVVWVPEMLPAARGPPGPDATPPSFVCPSIYEPLGIVNLEAMACEHGRRGQRRRRHPRGRRRRLDRAARALRRTATRRRSSGAGRRRERCSSTTRRAPQRWARPGRQRAIDEFGWDVAAAPHGRLYRSVLA